MKKIVPKPHLENPINEATLFEHISKIIEDRKFHAAVYANCEVNLMGMVENDWSRFNSCYEDIHTNITV